MADVLNRQNAFQRLTRLQEKVDALDVDTVTTAEIKVFLDEVDRLREKAEDSHNKIVAITTSAEGQEVQRAFLNNIEDCYFKIRTTLLTLQYSCAAQNVRPRPVNVRLPDMPLPTFDGKFEDWPTFSDLFIASIDKNGALSPSQKLRYLKSCVKGEAANLIKTFTVTDANYVEAFQLLETHYDNKREIVQSIVKKLVFQPTLKTESVTALQQMLNTTLECIRSLKVLQRPTDTWDDLLCVIIVEKLDYETKAEWAKSLVGTDPPTLDNLTAFLTRNIRTLHAKGAVRPPARPQGTQFQKGNKIHTHLTSVSSCLHCKGQHQLFQCATLRELQHDKRLAAIKAAKACFNCLGSGHLSSDCRSGNCKKCDERHHTLLHLDQQHDDKGNASSDPSHKSAMSSSSKSLKTFHFHTPSTVLLKTACVDVVDCYGVKTSVRILSDEGGEGCLVKESVLLRLGLKRERSKMTITGVGDFPSMQSKWIGFTTLHSQVNNSSIDVKLHSVQRITGKINQLTQGETRTWTHIAGLQLADPTFFDGGDVDILLGSDVVPYLLRPGLKTLDQTAPVAQETIFGWVLFGNVGSSKNTTFRIHSFQCEISQALKLFWEIEEVPAIHPWTAEEQLCENHFIKTHTRLPTGRYEVRLPFKDKKNKLGSSRDSAVRRLRSLEKRFEKNPQYKAAYIDFMREYIALGHMEPVKFVSKKVSSTYYLPHHFVLKEDSTTTKQRTVFDGSAKTSSGLSLNDVLMVGPTVQPELYTLLLRFRYNPIALKADIAKMYRQFSVHPDDRDYQRIVWREDPFELERDFRLNTVTYGEGCSSFLATRCLKQLAIDEEIRYPAAAKALLTSTYVDDFLGSESSVSSAKTLVKELIGITAAAEMEIRKWCSNSMEVLQDIPESLREEGSTAVYLDSSDSSIKALGIKWDPSTDQFLLTVNIDSTAPTTKRVLLSETSKTFDPIGWLSPITVNAKLMMQRVWLEGQAWDEPISEPIQTDWNNYVNDLQKISSLKIPRCVITSTTVSAEIHGFCDSSELAYACSVYLKCTYSNQPSTVMLLTSRTKVAPIKCISLPKLELSGAKLLADTINVIKKTLDIPFNIFCWTDSTITLRWITAPSSKWKTFVANRVASIQTIVPPEHWRHVRSADNPADLPSRGADAETLIKSQLWWHGPSWLQQVQYPNSTATCNDEEVNKEARAKALACFHHAPYSTHNKLFSAFSSLSKLLSCTAYVIRFISYVHERKVLKGIVSTMELCCAKMRLIRWAQQASFTADILALQDQDHVPSNSKLVSLNPFLDSLGILRVGGRLHKTTIVSENTRHPIILAHDHLITPLIIDHVHLQHLHAAFTLTHSVIRREYWILRGRNTIRFQLRKCVTCRRHAAATATQLMGSLPTGRVNPSRPCLHSGVDFAGPFQTKVRKGRHVSTDKAYFAIFVCLSTKAIHLEAVTSLSSEAFVACYERFVSRRGIPSHMYSDCGTNFVGANRILNEFLKTHNEQLHHSLVRRGTNWAFNPPSAPHHGGLWEAGVKSVKHHLQRVVGQRVLLLEEFQTLLCKIEECLNSRPLCALSAEPEDLDVLTPGHFLIGELLTNIPEKDLTPMKEGRLKQWEVIRQLTQRFWRRWTNEYLTSLQQRHKWTMKGKNMQVGDLVVVADNQMPVAKWKLGRIIATHPGTDGLVRCVTVKTPQGEYKRPITKLSPLLLN